MAKIDVCRVCECGNKVPEETHNRYANNCFIFRTNVEYICGECGKKMIRKIIKTEITETETEIIGD